MKALLGVSSLWGLGILLSCAAQSVTPFSDADGGNAQPPPKDAGGGTFGDSWTAPPQYDSSSPPPPPTDSGGPPPATCTSARIDDMEHGDNSIIKVDARTGFWYTYNDGSTAGAQTPPVGMFAPTLIPGGGPDNGDAGADGGGTDLHAAETTGMGFSNWGAGMGFDLNDLGGSSAKMTYDATGCAYTGLTFWARVGTGSTAVVRLNVPDKNTDPSGGVCAPAAKCNDHFGTSLTLSSSWTLVTVKWSDLKQLGWGLPQESSLATGALVGVQFQFAASSAFDLFIDDISFTK